MGGGSYLWDHSIDEPKVGRGVDNIWNFKNIINSRMWQKAQEIAVFLSINVLQHINLALWLYGLSQYAAICQ